MHAAHASRKTGVAHACLVRRVRGGIKLSTPMGTPMGTGTGMGTGMGKNQAQVKNQA